MVSAARSDEPEKLCLRLRKFSQDGGDRKMEDVFARWRICCARITWATLISKKFSNLILFLGDFREKVNFYVEYFEKWRI